MATLTVEVDHRQPRLLHDALSYTTTGYGHGEEVVDRPVRGYSTYHRSQTSGEDDTWVDPITGTLMLTPLPLLNAWQSNSSGDFARLTKPELVLITSSNWLEHNVTGLSSKFIYGRSSTVNEPIRTAATYPANRALYMTCHAAAAEGEDRPLVQVGWGYQHRDGQNLGVGYNPEKSVYVQIWTSAKVEVYLDGEYQGEGSLTPPGSDVQKSVNEEWLRVLLIPMRDGILIYSTSGGGYFWVRPDLEPGQENAVITPASDVWWYAFGAPTVELAPLRYRRSGFRCSLAARWSQAPRAGASESHYIYGLTPSGTSAMASFVSLTNAAVPFAPDGVTKECRVRFDLAGDGANTPFIWAAQSVFVQDIDETDDSEMRDITSYVQRASLEVPESGEVSVSLRLVNLGEMEEADDKPPHLEAMVGRPVRLRIGDIDIVDGMVTERPVVKRSTSLGADQLSMEVGGLYWLLKRYRFRDPVPLDAATVSDSLRYVANRAGVGLDRVDIEEFDLVVGEFVRPSKGEFHACVKVGDTAAEWWERLMEEYLADCHWCEAPGDDGVVRLSVWSPENIKRPSVPYRIFDRADDAIEHLEGLGFEGEELEREMVRRVYRTLDERGFAPEANSVWVQGLDRRTQRPIVVYRDYSAAQDPRIPPSERVPEWSGDQHLYGVIATALATEEQCANACDRLFRRLAYGRDLMEIEIDMMVDPDTGVPLWTGWEIEVQRSREDMRESGEPRVDLYTIRSFSGEFVREVDEDDTTSELVVRPFKYVIERQRADLPEGETSLGLGHKTPAASLAEMAMLKEFRVRKNFLLKPEDLVPRLRAIEL